MRVSRSAFAASFALVAACSREEPPPSVPSEIAYGGATAPTAASTPIAKSAERQAAPALPPIATQCSTHRDCAVTLLDVAGPRPCCAGCGTSTAGTRASIKAYEAACRANAELLRECPALACPSGPLRSGCVNGACVTKWTVSAD